ncbi:NAD(P)/FAD-dependent oxidoreductase [Thalassospira sp.]|uniref:NAD(P)/FAD-dependent oxidoreductase n=1 Tax=Thalassospira sp. TaxID=1912094 RepID=UPI0032ECA6D0
MKQDCDIAVIGAGPAGSTVAKLLNDAGLRVTLLEAQKFPRFVIGESLLPNCMNVLERAGFLPALEKAGFQHKNGAVFECGEQYRSIDFRQNFETTGWGTTYQVKRAEFDHILAKEAERSGVDIRFEHKVTAVHAADNDCQIIYEDAADEESTLRASFIVDASGYGRVLPRLLGLSRPPQTISRRAVFTHVKDRIDDPDYDRTKILITVHPDRHDIWYWLIPFSDGTASVGVIYPDGDTTFTGMSEQDVFDRLISETRLGHLLANAEQTRPLQSIAGYGAESEKLCGDGYVLLGNSAGFLDPVFSSGVTIALHSAELAANMLIARHRGETDIDWEAGFSKPLSCGVETFRSYVDAWYAGRLQTIIFGQPNDDSQLKRMVVSILAGYAWNMENPLVAKTDRYLELLHDLCAPSS